MSESIVAISLLVIAVIHIIPLAGFLGVERLESLYAVPVKGNDMEILMRHRAMLFGILGVFFAYAAFTPSAQPLAFIAAFASLASFFYLAISIGEYNHKIRKVVIADVIATICLVVAVVFYYTGEGF